MTKHSTELRSLITSALARDWYYAPLPEPLEAEITAAAAPRRLRQARFTLMVVALASVAMLWLDGPSTELGRLVATVLRLGVDLPVGLGAAWLIGRCRTPAQQATLFSAAITIFLTSSVVMAHYAGGTFSDRYVMVGGLTMFTINLLVPMRLRHTAIFTLAALLCYLTAALLPFGPFVPGPRDLILFLVALALFSVRMRGRLEHTEIQGVLLRLMDRLHAQELARANAQLHELSHTDPLTGLANRRSFDEALLTAWQDAAAAGTWLGLLMLDVDHFKRFNDAAGHAEGDQCLRLIARALREHVRQGMDKAARYGGEEFIALLPGATARQASEIAERVRHAVEVMCVPHPGHPGRLQVVTVSIGVAAVRPAERSTNPARLITAADTALYAAKAAGRNRVAPAEMAYPGAAD